MQSNRRHAAAVFFGHLIEWRPLEELGVTAAGVEIPYSS